MKVCIEIRKGNGDYRVTKTDIQSNIDVMDRAISNCMTGLHDETILQDIKTILEGIQRELPVKWP